MDEITIRPLEHPVNTSVHLPGCIGYTIRALNLAALTKGTVKIANPLKSDDTHVMVQALRTLGIAAEEREDFFVVHGDISDIKPGDYEINIGLSGRSARTLLALLCIVPGDKVLTCAQPFKKRPVGDLVEGLRQLGADIEYLEQDGHLPVKIASQKLRPGAVRMPGQVSSQFFSAVMMVAPAVGEIKLEVAGEQSSKPFIDMTIGIMEAFGVPVQNDDYRSYRVGDRTVYKNPKIYTVEPEATSASYFFATAALTKSTIKVADLSPDSLQGDRVFADVLEQMGCKVRKNRHEKWIEVQGTGTLRGVVVDMNATPDLVPTLAVVAAFAKGKTTITGIAHARLKETDRIEAPSRELAKMGIRTEATEDSLTVFGGSPKPAAIDTYHDHRMAMAFAVAGLRVPGLVVRDPGVVSKSFPEFLDVLGALTTKENIVLTGMRGSGKSTVGQLLAKRLGRRFLSMDKILEERTQLTIPQLVQRHGWDYFRDHESQLAIELSKEKHAVIATGGGVILRQQNITELKRHGRFVFLDASIDNLEARIKDETHGRPALTNAKTLREELQQILDERETIYKKTADQRIRTDGRTPAQIVDTITKQLHEVTT